jgi:methylenetetrahydrofolate reductase (NADPH)
MQEEVRPINWANRPKSYIKRTVTWDEFPNGRWGDNRSPAFGDLPPQFFRTVEGTRDHLLSIWGQAPLTYEDVYEVFARYIEGRIPILPWCEASLQSETIPLSSLFAAVNRGGLLTINSQPAVNGVPSDHEVYGWGGAGGRVYQKAYVEFFVSPELMPVVMEVVSQRPSLRAYAIDVHKMEQSCDNRSVTALTWGVFPDKEILQPTVFDHDAFIVWSEEAFELWKHSWACLYHDDSESSDLLYKVCLPQFVSAVS